MTLSAPTHSLLPTGSWLILLCIITASTVLPATINAQETVPSGCFDIATNANVTPLFVSPNDWPGVQRAMGDLQSDLRKLTQNEVRFQSAGLPHSTKIVIAGTVGKSPEIDALIAAGTLDGSFLDDAWEAYHIEVIEHPFEGVEQALVIAGSDKRGTIFGIYEISRQMGVSPWYFWADVPVPHKKNIAVVPGCLLQEKPAVQYRGIFLNDENPALYGWVHETYGGFNHEFYGDVFELMLRLKSNYLWTAMWGKAFYDDDPLNAPTADMYGVVIGTSHHEPMGRAHVEWDRYGEGAWNYQTNEETLKKFWKEGIERIGSYEATITLAMRGDGDEAMSDETNVDLLQRIVADQREIIAENSQQDPDKELQLWALYKEVQQYYEDGMRAPDDVMLLLADDNWGNARLLPPPGTAKEHPGGWGLYYHFDYVGDPRNYKWINTNQISRVWEQMNLAWEHEVERMWLVNVGDLKPMEYPISFFLDHAWNPDAMTMEKMTEYPQTWAAAQFGPEFAQEIGHILTTYTKYNARRKHELLSPETYDLVHFREAAGVVADYNKLREQTKAIEAKLPAAYHDAFYQLVLHPVEASANLNELYYTAALNHLYADQGRGATNAMIALTQKLFAKDQQITDRYHSIANGKWNHMMDQTHIGYTYWQQPDENTIPETVEILNLPSAALAVAVEGSDQAWPGSNEKAELPTFDKFNRQLFYVDIFNRGSTPFAYTVTATVPWITFTEVTDEVTFQQRIFVSIDWELAPTGSSSETITISSEHGEEKVWVHVFNPATELENFTGFVEANGYVSIEAENFSRATSTDSITWKVIPNFGKTKSGVTTFPPTHYDLIPGETSPQLEYDFYLWEPGPIKINTLLSPSLQFNASKGLKMAIAVDDNAPQVINIHEGYNWYQIVGDNINQIVNEHTVAEPGAHTLKIWAIDPSVVLQKIIIQTEEIPRTYLGPPQSYFHE